MRAGLLSLLCVAAEGSSQQLGSDISGKADEQNVFGSFVAVAGDHVAGGAPGYGYQSTELERGRARVFEYSHDDGDFKQLGQDLDGYNVNGDRDGYNVTAPRRLAQDGPPPPDVLTLAGSGAAGSADGAGAAASFTSPSGVAVSPNGSTVFVADQFNIRAIEVATGEVSTLAGSGSLGSADGAGAAASFRSPYALAVSPDGTTVYVADTDNHKIRTIVVATGEVSTLAGSGSPGSSDATGAEATFTYPFGVAVSPDGTTVYVADADNHKIRAIVVATGEVSTLAGSGGQGSSDGTGAAASFNGPTGVATSPNGTTVYVADGDNNKVRAIAVATGEVSTLAGSGSSGSSDGSGAAASFDLPRAIAVWPDGSTVYVADANNHKIRAISVATGEVSTLAGSGSSGSADGAGTTASFNWPSGVVVSPDGATVYVADQDNHKIREVALPQPSPAPPALPPSPAPPCTLANLQARPKGDKGWPIACAQHVFQPNPDNPTVPFDLSGAYLSYGDFSGATVTMYEYADSDWDENRFWGSAVNFSGAHLSHADFRGAYLHGALQDVGSVDFTDADLRYADMRDAYVGGAMGGYYWGASGHSMNVDFSNANLRGADLSNAIIGGRAGSPNGEYVNQVKFTNADLRSANMSNLTIMGETKNGLNVDFSNANLRGADLRSVSIFGDATRLQLDYSYDDFDANGERTPDGVIDHLQGVGVRYSYGKGIGFTVDVNFTNADLGDVDMSASSFSGNNVDFSFANLTNADLSSAEIGYFSTARRARQEGRPWPSR